VFCGDFGLNTAEAEPVDMRLPPSRQPIREFGDRGVLDAEARTGSGGKAGIYQEIGQHQKAIDDYSEAIDISIGFGRYEHTVSEVRRDGPPYNWLYGRARSHAWIGEYLRAKVYYTMAIDVRPDSYDSYLGMGWCYEQEGNLEKAAEYNAKANALRRRR
jgi:tetratricopeptide (TPR) repeat protein